MERNDDDILRNGNDSLLKLAEYKLKDFWSLFYGVHEINKNE